MNGRPLIRGDIVEVKRFVLDGAFIRETWILATVVEVGADGNIAVMLGGKDAGEDFLLALPGSERGRAWR